MTTTPPPTTVRDRLAARSQAVDAIVRSALHEVFSERTDLTLDAFTWLALGSNGRREMVPSSDVDSAVVFADWVAEASYPRYRQAFAEVIAIVGREGALIDDNGVQPTSNRFSRSDSAWRHATVQWLEDPECNDGIMMTSLLSDARPIYGDASLPSAFRVLRTLHRHPATMKLLLLAALSRRARIRTRWAIARRDDAIDIKHDVVTPIVNLARWAAISRGSSSLSTVERLREAGGSPVLSTGEAETLVDVVDAVQRLRLRRQLTQLAQGRQPHDTLNLHELSSPERSTLAQAVHHIAGIQQRLGRLASFLPATHLAAEIAGETS